MKRLLLILLFILFAGPVWAQTYFGEQTITGTLRNMYDETWIYKNITHSTPAGGTWQVVAIEAYVKQSEAGKNIRLAIYDTSKNLVCQGSAAVTVVSSTGAWEGHVGVSNISPNPCNLSASTAYKLAATGDTNAYVNDVDTGSSGDMEEIGTNYTSGFPASMGSGSDSTRKLTIRVQIQSGKKRLTLLGVGE